MYLCANSIFFFFFFFGLTKFVMRNLSSVGMQLTSLAKHYCSTGSSARQVTVRVKVKRRLLYPVRKLDTLTPFFHVCKQSTKNESKHLLYHFCEVILV